MIQSTRDEWKWKRANEKVQVVYVVSVKSLPGDPYIIPEVQRPSVET